MRGPLAGRSSPTASGGWLPESLAAGVLGVAMVAGGHALGRSDAAVHAVATLALGMSLWRWRTAPLQALQRVMVALLAGAVALALFQLVPISSDTWQELPGRRVVLEENRLAGLAVQWLPMTLDPVGTLRALLALTAFAAMWMLCTTLTASSRTRLFKLAAGIAVPLALLGLVQATQKADTTGGSGLFENRNHHATLMAMLLPAAIAAARDARDGGRHAPVLAWHGVAAALLLGAALTFSRAGFVLALLSACASVVLLAPRAPRRRAYAQAAAAAMILGLCAVAIFPMERLAARFGSSLLGDLRWQYLANGYLALREYLPWGGGLGTFRQLYAQAEPLRSLGEFTYANHAHNELLQNGIEAGVPGLLLMLVLAGLVVAAGSRILRTRGSGEVWRRAALVAVCVPLLHSLVDYPLRTFACSIPFALALAILLAAPDHVRRAIPAAPADDARLP